MGACTFYQSAEGRTAQEAFKLAREEAAWEHGHGGYTGTIAEKDSFKLVNLSEEIIKDQVLLSAKIDELIDTEFDDKWGPAGCVKTGENTYLFFGWASE